MKEKTQDKILNTIAMDIKRTLAKEGFRLSLTNPCYARIHGEQVPACPLEDLGLSFYIIGPPIPPVAPFDFITVYISLEKPEMGGICFQLTFCFHAALEPCMEVNEIEAVYQKHDSVWFPNLSDYLTDVEDSFKLSWDTEYDESIEDNLTGWIPLEKYEIIHDIMKKLQQHQEEWLQREKTYAR
ncbi:MAG: hypothetical protein WC347_11060 [Smithellaceae bacterium]